MKKNSLCTTALLVVAAAAAGCGYSLKAEDQTEPPIAVEVSGDEMSLPVGIAVGFRGVPRNHGDELDEEVGLEILSDDPTIARVDPTTSARGFVIYGVRAGTTTLTVLLDGDEELILPVTVTAQ